MPLTNLHEIDLSLAVWLLHDEYDFNPQHNAISATGLLKPTRQIILAQRLNKMIQKGELPEQVSDISGFTSLRLGHAIHDSVEHAWKNGYRRSMELMNIPSHVIDTVRINPEKPDPNTIPVYIEKRSERTLKGFTISGKLDFAIQGRLKDIKSTSVYTYLLGRKDEDYQWQGSIYKWLNEDIITEDEIDIQFVFTDWSKADSLHKKDYPQHRILSYSLPLHSPKETENKISRKIEEISHFREVEESQLPRCTDEDLWRSPGVWKYYSDPSNTKATRNFDNPQDAKAFHQKAGKGVVRYVPGKVRACSYCRAFPICSQKDEYSHD